MMSQLKAPKRVKLRVKHAKNINRGKIDTGQVRLVNKMDQNRRLPQVLIFVRCSLFFNLKCLIDLVPTCAYENAKKSVGRGQQNSMLRIKVDFVS